MTLHGDAALAEAMAARLKLATEGRLLEPVQFLEKSGLSRHSIGQQTRTGSLFTVDGPNGTSYYPAFFADRRLDRAAVSRVARALNGLSGASKWVFFTSPRRSLGGLTPLEVIGGATPTRRDNDMAEGVTVDLSLVLRAAAAYVEE